MECGTSRAMCFFAEVSPVFVFAFSPPRYVPVMYVTGVGGDDIISAAYYQSDSGITRPVLLPQG